MKTSIVLLAAIVCAVAEPQILYKNDWPYVYDRSIINPLTPVVRDVIPGLVPITTGLKSQYYDRDLIGQAKYGHIEPGQSHHAVQDAFGNKVGSFSYYDAEGKLVETSYVADGAGYRVKSKSHLPLVEKVAPVLPLLDTHIVKTLPKTVILGDIDRINIRAKRDVLLAGRSHLISSVIPTIDYKLTPHALPTTITEPKLKIDGFLDDTPEVKFAKNRHLNEVEIAKLRNLSPLVSLINPTLGSPFYNYQFIDPIVRL